METPKTQHFKVGQSVVWNGNSPRIDISFCTKRYGNGLSKITCTENVPNECTCGHSLNDDYHRHGGCPYTSTNPYYGKPKIRAVGHPQLVKIADANGNKVGDLFSGLYFLPYEKVS